MQHLTKAEVLQKIDDFYQLTGLIPGTSRVWAGSIMLQLLFYGFIKTIHPSDLTLCIDTECVPAVSPHDKDPEFGVFYYHVCGIAIPRGYSHFHPRIHLFSPSSKVFITTPRLLLGEFISTSHRTTGYEKHVTQFGYDYKQLMKAQDEFLSTMAHEADSRKLRQILGDPRTGVQVHTHGVEVNKTQRPS